MTYFNPLIAPVAQGPQAQRAAADKERQIARSQARDKNSAADEDRFEHTVESADALTPVGDDTPNGGGNKQRRQPNDARDEATPEPDEEQRGLDVTG